MGRLSKLNLRMRALSRQAQLRWKPTKASEESQTTSAGAQTGNLTDISIPIKQEVNVEENISDYCFYSGRVEGEDVKLEVKEDAAWNGRSQGDKEVSTCEVTHGEEEKICEASKQQHGRKLRRGSKRSSVKSITLLPSQSRAQIKGTHRTPRNCLLCFKSIKSSIRGNGGGSLIDMYRRQARSSVEANFDAMFILKKMLSIPNDKLVHHLERDGSPCDWISFCDKCIDIVDEAVRLQNEIRKLEASLRKCGEQMISKIKTTWNKKKTVGNPGAGPVHKIRQLIVGTDAVRGQVSIGNMEAAEVDADNCLPDNECDEDDYERSLEDMAPPSPVTSAATVGTLGSIIDRKEVESLYSGKYSCHLCPSLGTMSLNNLADHIMFHYRRPLKCVQCNAYYSKEADLANKFLKKSLPATTDVHECSSDTLTTVHYHPWNITPWKCAHCLEQFTSEVDRDLHQTSTHVRLEPEGSFPPAQHECIHCSKTFHSLGERRLHRALEHAAESVFSCIFCDLSFKTKSREGIDFCDFEKLKAHLKKEHQSLRPSDYSIMKLPDECDLCGATFARFVGLQKHMEEIHQRSKKDSYPCPVCPTRTSEWTNLFKHLESMHRPIDQISKHICDSCGYKCLGNSLRFEEHQFEKHGIVPGTRPVLNCPVIGCPFQCVAEAKMKRHMMKEHASERKHKCSVCGKGFLTSQHLRRHENIHLNSTLKPFQCEICGNSFAVRNYLYIHMRLSHQNRPFASTHKKKRPRKKISSPSLNSQSTIENDPQLSTELIK